MGAHRAEGSAFRRQADPVPPARPVHGRRRAEPVPRPARRRRARRTSATPAWVRGLPQASVVGVLGVATIVAPLAGDVLIGEPVSVAEASGAAPEVQAPRLTRAQKPAMVSDFRVVPPVEPQQAAEPPASLVSPTGQPMTPEHLAQMRSEAEQASRDLERSVLPGCEGKVSQTGAANGRLDTDDLCLLWDTGHMLRADAAVTFARLNVAYENTFGEAMCLTDSYRSYSAQVRLRASKPRLAAPAGMSEHGWGLAVDLCGGVERNGERHQWLRDNAPQYGWDNPEWARKGGSGPYEPWHWEYVVGQG